jgi:hypothetical protein
MRKGSVSQPLRPEEFNALLEETKGLVINEHIYDPEVMTSYRHLYTAMMAARRDAELGWSIINESGIDYAKFM